MAQAELDTLETALGHTFTRRTLLELALTHSSVAHERGLQPGSGAGSTPHPDEGLEGARGRLKPASQVRDPRQLDVQGGSAAQFDNEQLEFLGDAALGLLVADELYRRFPALDEGGLTRLRASLVSRKHLGEVGARLQLGAYLQLGRGEDRSGGRRKSALLANALEAVFAAIYLDAGLEALRTVVRALVVCPSLPDLESALGAGHAMGDHKSALQEFLQATGAGQPRYVVLGEAGPDHRKRFTVEVRLQRSGESSVEHARPLASASGSTKKQAQQEAARVAYQGLTEGTAEGTGRPL